MPRVKVTMPETFAFHTDIPIRIDDINYGAHLGNDSVLTLAHEARIRFFHNFGFQEQDIDGLGILIADAAIEYKAQGFYGQTLRIHVGVADIARKGCDIVYRFTNRDTTVPIALVKTGIVFFDYQSQNVARIPGLFLQRLGLPET